MSLTELKPSDHPDCHVMQWTDMEIRFINDRVSAATAPLQEQIKELTAERDQWKDDAMNGANAEFLRGKVRELERQLALSGQSEMHWKSRTSLLFAQLEQARKDAEPRAPEQLDAGAKKLAELFDYPWAHMPEQGRQTMRNNVIEVLQVIDAAISKESK
jgi:hypothetical protein